MTTRITWIGHATVLIDADGYRIVTDPALTPRLAHLRRRVELMDVGPVDAVLISHVHMDHLHVPSLRLVARGAHVVVPAGGVSLLKRVGAASIEPVTPGDCVKLHSLKVDVVHAEHPATRGPHSSVRAQPVGYVIDVDGRRIYFAGDTGLFDGMNEVAPLDVGLLPIWGWGSTLGDGHLDPTTAAAAVSRMQPRRVVPIHWGTYSPIRSRRGSPEWLNNPLVRFRQELSTRAMDDRLTALEPGGSIDLE